MVVDAAEPAEVQQLLISRPGRQRGCFPSASDEAAQWLHKIVPNLERKAARALERTQLI